MRWYQSASFILPIMYKPASRTTCNVVIVVNAFFFKGKTVNAVSNGKETEGLELYDSVETTPGPFGTEALLLLWFGI